MRSSCKEYAFGENKLLFFKIVFDNDNDDFNHK